MGPALYDPRMFIERVWHGVVASTITSYWKPLLLRDTFSVDNAWILKTLVFAFLAVAAIAGLRGGQIEWTRALRISVFSLVWIVASIAPPSVAYVPTYPGRTLHFASFGSIALFLALLAFVFARWRAGMLVVLGLSTWMFAGSAKSISQQGAFVAANSVANMRFWKQMTDLLPTVEEGTVVKLSTKPDNFPFNDYALTWIFRALTGTKYTAMLGDSPADDTTLLDLSDRLYSIRPEGQVVDKIPGFAIHPPNMLRLPARQGVAPETVVVLQWDRSVHQLHLVPEESAMRRILPAPRSWLSRVLFTGVEGDWASRETVCINTLSTLHFASEPPSRTITIFRIYDALTAVGVLTGNVSEGSSGPDSQCKAAALGDADILARVPSRGRFSISGHIRRRAEGKITVGYNALAPEDLDPPADLRPWQSKPLQPGAQVVQFRREGGGQGPWISLLEPHWLRQ